MLNEAQSTTETLEVCPCNSAVPLRIDRIEVGNWIQVVCDNCGRRGAQGGSRWMAEKLWNQDRRCATAAPVVDESELRFALEGMIAAFDTDNYSSASIVATTRECALSVAKQAVGWPAAATTAAPPVDAETFVKQWIATLQDESHVTDEDAEDLVFRIIAYKNTAAAPVEQAEIDQIRARAYNSIQFSADVYMHDVRRLLRMFTSDANEEAR